MKKLISMILALSIMMTMCIPVFADVTRLGDVNRDGKISAVDARMVLQVVAGLLTETSERKYYGDVNGDGKLSAVDARMILQIVAGIIPAPETPSEPEKTTYGIGETWIVPGQWEITVNSATIHSLCNSYSNEKNGYTNQQVVLVEYTYKNLGIEDGLYLSSIYMNYYDGELESAERYACTHTKSPKECIIGAKCTASDAVVLENYSEKITVKIEKYDSNNNKQKALFELPIAGVGGNNSDNNEKLITLQDYKDYCINRGIYHKEQYGVSISRGSSEYKWITSMIYNPKTDQLRFEQVTEGEEQYRFIVLWVGENESSYKWQFQWITEWHIAGEGKLQKNKNLYCSMEEIEGVMRPYAIQEMNGQLLSKDSEKIFLSAAATDIASMKAFMQIYFDENNTNLNMDFFDIGT